MKRPRFSTAFILAILMLVSLLLAGCGGGAADEPAPPTSTEAPAAAAEAEPEGEPAAESEGEPASSTSSEGIPLATSTDQIVGTWQRATGAGYLRIYEDGSLHTAFSEGDLDDNPYIVCQYSLEGPQFLIAQCTVSGIAQCGDTVGTYEVQMLEDNQIRIEEVDDGCTSRRRELTRVYQAAP